MKNRALALSLFACLALTLASPAMAQKAVIVVRHAEKISDTDERLTEAGRARAARLSALLKDAGIGAIYATDTERARDTALPLAEALEQKVRIYDRVPALIEGFRKDDANEIVLVVGHSNTVPELLKALGAPDAITLAKDEYDNLFVVAPKGNGTATLVRMRY